MQEIDPNPENQRPGTGDEEGSFLQTLQAPSQASTRP